VKEFLRVFGLLLLLGFAFLAYPWVFLTSRFLPKSERREWRLRWQGMGCRWALAYLRCRVTVKGTLPPKGMLVSNHQGYLDILVLGSLDPASFVAKAEIRWWPIFGLFSWWAGTIFLERRNKTALKGPLHETIRRLDHAVPGDPGGHPLLRNRSDLGGGGDILEGSEVLTAPDPITRGRGNRRPGELRETDGGGKRPEGVGATGVR